MIRLPTGSDIVNTLFTGIDPSGLIYESIKALEIKTSMHAI